MEFTTKIKGKHLEALNPPGLSEKDNFDTGGCLTVTWFADIEEREWGIKSVHHGITSVSGELELNIWGDSEDSLLSIDIQADLDSDGFKIIDRMEMKKGWLSPGEVSINFKTKTIRVE